MHTTEGTVYLPLSTHCLPMYASLVPEIEKMKMRERVVINRN